MDIQAEKKTLVQLLLNTDDVTILKKVKAIFISTPKNDWWDDLSDEQKYEIEEANNEIDRGEFLTSEAFFDLLKNK